MTAAREAMLDAGRRLALRHPLGSVDPVRVVTEARVGLDAFDQTFGGFDDYLQALQQQFMEGLRDKIFSVTTGTSGLMRLKLATETYLQGCLAERPLRDWLIDGRMRQPQLLDDLRKQNQVYWIFLGSEFRALGWPYPQAAARLFLAMANEAAQAEHRAGHALDSIREALWDFLERGHRT